MWKKLIVGTLSAIAVIILLTVGCTAILGATQHDTPTTKPSAQPHSAKPKPTDAEDTWGDGTYKVGDDIPAGSFRTEGSTDENFGSCYWARLSDDSGGVDAIITNDFFSGPGRVSIKPGEFVQFSGHCSWTKIN
jgi:hypothetical protein